MNVLIMVVCYFLNTISYGCMHFFYPNEKGDSLFCTLKPNNNNNNTNNNNNKKKKKKFSLYSTFLKPKNAVQ